MYFVCSWIKVGPSSPGVAHCNRIPGHRTGNFAANQKYWKKSQRNAKCSIFIEVVADKVERLIALLKLSKNTVVYTGIEYLNLLLYSDLK